MPNHRRRIEADRPSGMLQAPADVDVVTGRTEFRVPTADISKRIGPKCAVATRNMFGGFVVQQDMYRSARSVCHALGDPTVSGRSNIRAADAGVLSVHEGEGQVMQPVRVRSRIVVCIRNQLAGRGGQPGISGTTQPSVRRTYQLEWIFRNYFCRVVGRTVIYDYDFEIRIFELRQAFHAVPDRPSAVVTANNHRK